MVPKVGTLCLYFRGPAEMRLNDFVENKVVQSIFNQYSCNSESRNHANKQDWLIQQDVYYISSLSWITCATMLFAVCSTKGSNSIWNGIKKYSLSWWNGKFQWQKHWKTNICLSESGFIPSLGALKVEKIEEDSLDLIPSPSPLVKIQIFAGKVYLRQ